MPNNVTLCRAFSRGSNAKPTIPASSSPSKAPSNRSSGLGRQLVEAALAEARQYPRLKVIQLTVTAGNDAALALYQRCGFIQYGLEPLAVRVGVDYFDKIHMWRELQDQ